MISGILNVNKEVGISSNKCVGLVKKALNIKKVGHTGTLDLEAGGVLPIVIGKATRVSDFLMDEKKEYITEAIFGSRTDTLDWSGQVVEESDKTFTKDELISEMENFKGQITQIPPMYSAIKINGSKMYDLARKGIEVERKTRNVTIYDFKLLDFDFPKATFEITCSKGTYIRTLIDDLGEALGSFAYVNKLTRSKVGDFVIEEAISSADLLEMDKDQILKHIKPVDYALKDYKEIRLDKSYFKQATNGMTMRLDALYSDDLLRVYIEDQFIGLGKNFKNEDLYFLKMEKVFYEK
ncbi:tRNA pseudouridine(55) synthase TruB [Anaerococcus provencensis]|uniref:tRNA pseudouridine(55) synthase TruB n=1 Tax=Anaerococcus provencensis TaxID=938293 RepID=UPI000305A5DD|nr:tRNA pseudouridine(55) synthase TruB [Anaerococcus provencensis]